MPVTIGGGIVGDPTPTPAPTPPTPPAAPVVTVQFSKDIQTPPAGTNISASSTGSWAGSVYGGIADAMLKFFSMVVSPVAGYAKQTFYGESAMDFNGKGGLVAGFTGVARGFGKINTAPGAVNDAVGYNGIAIKDTNCWAAGVHGEVRDNSPGGTAIGVNGELVSTKKATHTIGINILNWEGNDPADEFCLGNGAFNEGFDLQGVKGMQNLLKLSTGSNAVWVYDPKPSVAIIGKLRITIDGAQFYIPVCT